jgi:hypothetical protein
VHFQAFEKLQFSRTILHTFPASRFLANIPFHRYFTKLLSHSSINFLFPSLLPSISSTLSPHSPLPRPSHLKTGPLNHPIKRNSRARLSSHSGIKLNIIGQLRLLSRQITVISSLSGLDLDTEDLSCELQDLVLYLAVLFLFR